jgi:hypothetical protein
MEVSLDVSAVPLTEEQIKVILDSREARPETETVEMKPDFKQEMIAAQEPLPDPTFTEGEVVPCTYAVGAPLSTLDAYDADFKEMIKEMFEVGVQLKLTKEGIDEQVSKYEETTADITLPMLENE